MALARDVGEIHDPMGLPFAAVSELAPRLQRRELSPVELTEAVLARIDQYQPQLNAYITVLADEAMARARQAEAEIVRGDYRGALHGIPIAHKDVLNTRGVRTTAHSWMLADNVPLADATAVERLDQAGAIVLGKLNTYEFACGSTEAFGVPVNPWDGSRTTGGSSAGSGAAVAAGLCFGATGTDTGGSIRSPASYCGVVGLKPTYGRVSRAGVIALSPSLDHVGTLTRTAQDAALLLEALAGPDVRDVTTLNAPGFKWSGPDPEECLTRVHGMRLGVPYHLFGHPVQPEVARLVEAAIDGFARMGVDVVEVELPFPELTGAALGAIMAPEATLLHEAWLRQDPSRYSPFTRQKLVLGACVEATEYLLAQQVRHFLTQQLVATFASCDALIWPTTSCAAPAVDTPEHPTGVQTRLANLTGTPSLSVPCGFTATGLPVGFQLNGRHHDEATLLSLAVAYETASGWRTRAPALECLTEPPVTKPYASPEAPSHLTQRDLASLERSVITALARRGIPSIEEDLAPLSVSLHALREGLETLRSPAVEALEPLVHQHVVCQAIADRL